MKTAEQWQQGEIEHGGIELALVRRIQIDALRHAREISLSAHAQMDEAVGTKQEIISELDKLIRELELR